MKRNCAICNSTDKKYIYTPHFFVVDKAKPFSYDIVICRECGFLFADNIPSQRKYDAFYKDNYKYAYNMNIPLDLKKIYKDIFLAGNSFLKRHFPKMNKQTFKIIDIGCSTGHILKLFKDSGFINIKGIEPSLRCKSIAKKFHGIPVVNCSLVEFPKNEKFDLIIMTGVLEHLCNLNGALDKVYSLLNKDGLLMVAIPDLDRFSENPAAPFDEFSLEHINYFNCNTLSNFMNNHYFKNIYSITIKADFYDSNILLCFLKKTTKIKEIKKDTNGYFAIKRYISMSKKKIEIINQKINYLVKSGSKVVIWGMGSLTARLLASTDLLKAEIKFFVDNNKAIQGKKINNIDIFSPSIFKKLNNGYKVFIGSYIYRNEIRDILVNKYNFKGEIISL